MFRKTTPSIQIPEPCNEPWSGMTPSGCGRFCEACEKVVVDFSAMNDAQIAAYLKKHSGQETCGRFQTSQLNRALEIERVQHASWRRALPLAAALGAAISVGAQTSPKPQSVTELSVHKDSRMLEGIVASARGPLMGATVTHVRLQQSVLTDAYGRFRFELAEDEWVGADELSVAFEGFSTQTRLLSEFDKRCLKIELERENVEEAEPVEEVVPQSIPMLVEGMEVHVRGTVVDDQSGEGLPFVLLRLRETTLAASTDFDGNFHLVVPFDSLPETPKLEMHYVGYESLVIPLVPEIVEMDTVAVDAPIPMKLANVLIREDIRAVSRDLQMIAGAVVVVPSRSRRVVQAVKRPFAAIRRKVAGQ